MKTVEAKRTKKLSYKEQREWDTMEESIGKAEARVARAQEALNDPNNASNASKLTELTTELAESEQALEKLFERWAELEKLKAE